jgi:hypothetical protein
MDDRRASASRGNAEGPQANVLAAALGDKGYADRRAEDRWSVVRCRSQQADPRPGSGASDGDREFDAVTAAPDGEAVVSKCPDDIAPVPKSGHAREVYRRSRNARRSGTQDQRRQYAQRHCAEEGGNLPYADGLAARER